MKKVLLVLVMLAFSCSNESEDSLSIMNGNYFLTVEIEGVTLRNENLNFDDTSTPWVNCYEGFSLEQFEEWGINPLYAEPIIITYVGPIETSKYDIDVRMANLEYESSFKGYLNEFGTSSPSTPYSFTAINYAGVYPLGFNNNNCLNHNIFIIDVSVDGEYLIPTFNLTEADSDLPSVGIESVVLVKESSVDLTYVYTGSFSVKYTKADGTLVPVTGQFRFPVYVTK